MSAASHPPVDFYSFFLTSLLKTVRLNIGENAACSYEVLGLAAVQDILMFDTAPVIR